MALTAHIQTLWKAKLEKYFDTLSVFIPALTNTNYQGELKSGGAVKIVSVGEVTEEAWDGNTWADSAWGTLSTENTEFTVDQKRIFRFLVGDLSKMGSILDLVDQGSQRALYAVQNRLDQYIATFHSSITTNLYGDDTTPITIGFNADLGEVLPTVGLSTLQEEMAVSNADQSSPNVVIPTWYAKMLRKELANRNTGLGDASMMHGIATGKMEGASGVAGFKDIYVSNNVANTAGEKYKIMAGTPGSSITVARTIETVETGRIQNGFGDFVKGLYVYGAKVPFEKHMALGTFNQGSIS